jgi:hypothetical protein
MVLVLGGVIIAGFVVISRLTSVPTVDLGGFTVSVPSGWAVHAWSGPEGETQRLLSPDGRVAVYRGPDMTSSTSDWCPPTPKTNLLPSLPDGIALRVLCGTGYVAEIDSSDSSPTLLEVAPSSAAQQSSFEHDVSSNTADLAQIIRSVH